MPWFDAYVGFDDTAKETARSLEKILDELGWRDSKQPEPSERLVRHYTQKGALDRPDQVGREARYGFRQLVQFIALRWLLDDGWPLEKAARETATRTTDDLLALVPGSAARARGEAMIAAANPLINRRAAAPAYDPVAERQRVIAERKARLAEDMNALASEPKRAGPRALLDLELTPWCRAQIDADRVETLTEREAETLGEALTQSLLDAKTDTKSGRRRR